MLKGILLAATAGTLANTGVFLQKVALDSRRQGASILSALKSSRWIAGFALLQIGWFAQVAALRLAPLYLVQPVVASGIVALVLLARAHLREPVDLRLAVSIGGVLAGAALLAASSAQATTEVSGSAPLSAFVVPLVTAGLIASWAFGGKSRRYLGLALAAGILYGAAVALSKPVAGQLTAITIDSLLDVATHKEIYLIGIVSTLGMVFNQVALAEGRVSVVSPLILATMTVLPIVFGLVIFGEALPPYPARAALWVGIATSLCGVVLLARAEGAEEEVNPVEADSSGADGYAERASSPLPPTTS